MRLALLQDVTLADELALLENEVTAFPWTAGMYRSALESATVSIWYGVQNEAIGCVLVLERVLDELTIQNLFVARAFQRQGLATKCLQQLCEQSKAVADWRILLEVRASNEAAIRLYQQAGFQQNGLRKGYYRAENGREDAILMEFVHD